MKMERLGIKIVYEKLKRGELTEEELADLEAATTARLSAHAPYSNYLVGAAIRTHDGNIFTGWNLENGIYVVSHAEQNALGSILPRSRESGIRRVTVVAAPRNKKTQKVAAICGYCRQLLSEFIHEGDSPQALMAGIRGSVIRIGLKDLLPLAFSLSPS